VWFAWSSSLAPCSALLDNLTLYSGDFSNNYTFLKALFWALGFFNAISTFLKSLIDQGFSRFGGSRGGL